VVEKAFEKLISDESLFESYLHHRQVGHAQRTVCGKECRHAMLCAMVNTDFSRLYECTAANGSYMK
jgi:hypothetical protein